MQNRQVALLIVGLMPDPTPIIHFACQCWVRDGKKSAGKTLIGLMYNETGLAVPKDFLHNQWINYYDHDKGLIKDTTPVYVPSRLYWFNEMKANISCNFQHGITGVPECSLSIIGPDETVTENLFSICHRICQQQTVRNLDIYTHFCKDLPEPLVFPINKNTESIEMALFKLPLQTLRPLVQQINGCSTLRVLDLSFTPLTYCLCGFLPDPHPGIAQLQELKLFNTWLEKDDLQHLIYLLQSHKLVGLDVLDLGSNGLLEMETDVEHLIKACVKHQRELELRMFFCDLSDALRHRCEGTKIKLKLVI